MRPIVVLGAGSWGTALAIQFARGGGPTVLWGRAEDEPEKLARERVNTRYLPGAAFPPALAIEPNLKKALTSGDDVVLVVPSSVLRAVLTEIRPLLGAKARVAWASKGFELSTGKLPHQVAQEVLGEGVPIAVLSGPTFAKEVGQGLPTAIAVASPDEEFARSLAERISSGGFRAYTQTDIVGVEIGGAVKNVLAIATGCSDGLGYGSNSRVFLITRGLAELMRLGVALGAKRETLMGLAGLGDLVLTCTDDQSRNRRFGRALAAGKPVDEAIAEIGQVVEGYHAARAVHEVAAKHGVEMPICGYVYDVLHRKVPLKDVVGSMLSRAVTPEN
ncbi:MAG TPA: NAD(P)H-dependent glycerol-3-phosphate dehydrogenase [Steroidobacteraceae bacterium]|nr:NAD(P)H-dependent glycerol-3-phosphate dehydrogenase [Steroidobacteraceae bacterium]